MRHLAGLAIRLLLAVALLSTVLPLSSTIAQIPSGGRIEEIRIEGAQRVEPETVRDYLTVKPGDEFDSDKLDASLKALYATGLFTDVTLRREGDVLIVRVVENPVINRIAFEGNHKLSDSTLNDEIQLRPRIVYTRQKVQSDVKRILDLYRRNGRFSANVDPKVIPLEQNRVDLVFEIDEGPATTVRGIAFVGNQRFSASRLREVIETKETRWYRFLSSSDTYDPDRLTYDRELLRKFYLSQGYADFRVVSAVAELAPAADGFLITFTIEEGERYKFGKIDITNQIKEIDPATLKPVVKTVEGDWYNADLVDSSITALTDTLGDRGFAFVDIQPQVHRDPDKHTIAITYSIKEGPRVYVERIDITGNLRTQDKVIRREFRLVEGDAFNSTKLHRSEQRLNNLGFFSKVDIKNVPGSAPDKTVINVNVQEKSTGEFSVGVGYSTDEGPLADIGIHERNLLGTGQDLRLDTLVAYLTQQVDLSYTDPYFLGRNLAAGFDLFALTQNNSYYSSFNELSFGGTLRAGYQITEALRQTLTYTLRYDRIYDVPSIASLYIQDQAGGRITSAIGQSLIYDRRDNRLFPTSGYYAKLGNDLAGFGGDSRYFRTSVSGGYYYPVAPQWVLSLTGESGYIVGINQNVFLEDRYFVGGDNLRGFAVSGVGPRDLSTSDSLGGNTYYAGSLTLGFPLGLPQELGINGRVFSDFGDLWGVEPSGVTVADPNFIRVSAGVGISWQSPLGPIRIDLGLPVRREPYDRSELVHVDFGSRF